MEELLLGDGGTVSTSPLDAAAPGCLDACAGSRARSQAVFDLYFMKTCEMCNFRKVPCEVKSCSVRLF